MHGRDPTSKCELCKVSACTAEIQIPKCQLCKVSTCTAEIQLPNVNCVKFQHAWQRSKCHGRKVSTCTTEIQVSWHKVLTRMTENQLSSVKSLNLSHRDPSVKCTKSWHAQQRSRCQVCKVLHLNDRDPSVQCSKCPHTQHRSRCQVYKVLTWPTEIQRQFHKVLTNLQAKNTMCTPVLKLSKKIQDGDTDIQGWGKTTHSYKLQRRTPHKTRNRPTHTLWGPQLSGMKHPISMAVNGL